MGFKRIRPGQMIANTRVIDDGLEAVWDKALGYITREPYRGLLVERLAEYRFLRAVSQSHLNVPEALAKLALARATSPKKVSALAYVIGRATIIVPGGSFLVRSRRLRAIRRLLAVLFAFQRPHWHAKNESEDDPIIKKINRWHMETPRIRPDWKRLSETRTAKGSDLDLDAH
jgi:hypothetical protein